MTSVSLTAPAQFSVTGSPVTGSSTLALAWQNQNINLVFASPASGSAGVPTFRSLATADLPLANFISETPPTGTAPTTTYVLSYVPQFVFGVFLNGLFQRPGIGNDYTMSTDTITFATATTSGDNVYAVYIK